MKQSFILNQKERAEGSYYRKDFLGDVIYNSFYHREFQINFAKKGRRKSSVSDETASFLLAKGLIDEGDLALYLEELSAVFTLETIPSFDSFSIESLYDFLLSFRKKQFGQALLEQAFLLAAKESTPLCFPHGIDQRERILSLCEEKEAILVAILEPALFATVKEFLAPFFGSQKRLIFIASHQGEKGLPTPSVLRALFPEEEFSCALLENGALTGASLSDPALLVFGEAGLLDCRSLRVSCGVFAKPQGYFASAVAGQLGLSRACAVFIPDGFSILPAVPITALSRLSYLILSKLAKTFGDEIYRLSVEELYGRFPAYFFNVYETSAEEASPAVIPSFSPEKQVYRPLHEWDALREEAIAKELARFPNCRYYTKLFTEKDDPGIHGKILVHGVKVKSTQAKVIPCGKDISLREKMREMKEEGTALVSNFLFFLTPKLAALYNTLRDDRKEEQASVDTGHLDYLLEYRNGKRVESFPLFRKTCIAMKENGEFLFFPFRLGGGCIRLNQIPLCWKKEDVDPCNSRPLPPVCIYTPYLSAADQGADRENYRKSVGENRFNLVLIQDRITALRQGDVILPGMGVVLSLDQEKGKELCEALHLTEKENGYFSVEKLSFDVKLDAPEGICETEWSTVQWAYGGGLSLLLDGVGLCDGDHMKEWFDREGWTSPLSCQTQESTLHSLVKHPRTAVGTTEDGSLAVLVFSGRTDRSDGADYGEMCLIARKLIPDLRFLMNVDGGGSAVLGMVYNGNFTELSLPSTSTGSTVGMVRPINTALWIPLEKGK